MYTNFEGFDTNDMYSYFTNPKNTQEDRDSINAQFSDNYVDISNNIAKYSANRKALQSNNAKYHYDDNISSMSLIDRREKNADIYSVVNTDINELQLYQNSIYITGAIACATLLITAIFIGRK